MKSLLRHLCLLILFQSASGMAKNFEFLKGGKLLRSYSRADLKKLSPEIEVTLFEPHLKKNHIFLASDFRALLERIYGSNWTKAKLITFVCSDGYQPTVKIERLLKGTPYLAFAYKEGKFETTKANKTIPLGPGYLVWSDPMDQAKRLQDLGAGNWPYQLEKINLVP